MRIPAVSVETLVYEFHKKFEVELDATRRAHCWQLIREEAMEVRDAIKSGDREHIAQELADLVYVAYDAALHHGIWLDNAIEAVHAANMSKMGAHGPLKDPVTGKVMKGPNYRPPDLSEAVLELPEP